MALKLLNPPIPASHVGPPSHKIKRMRCRGSLLSTHSRNSNCSSFWEHPSGIKPIFSVNDSQPGTGLVGDVEEILDEAGCMKLADIKQDLYEAVRDINRGIFGVPSEKKSRIESLVRHLESRNPTPDPTLNLEKLGGCWKLVYSTITILGFKRTKLGLRDFVTLGEFLQTIDVSEGKAVNLIKFSVSGLTLLNGELRVESSYTIASNSRVEIKYSNSDITPIQLMNVFRKNYDLLLGIFNPEGWLDIKYVDDTLRIGRDDKGNLFILERSGMNNP